MPDTLELVKPAHLWVPPHFTTAGEDAADVAAAAGIELDPEQRLTLDTLLAEDEAGFWVTLENAVVEPRQNGKTVDLEVIALHDLFVAEVGLVTWTAHLFDTAQEAFRNLDEIIAGTPSMSAEVRNVSRANGNEEFEFFGDRRLQFKARSKTGGRGLSGDTIILDEAWALGTAEMGSLLPTLSARPNPHVFYGSSGGLASSALLRDIRDRGRRGGDPSLSYIEWCASDGDCSSPQCDHRPGSEGCLLDDEQRWAEANPALGRRITVSFMRSERRALPPDEFAREILGWWDEPAAGPDGIPAELWAKCAKRDAVVDEPCAIALDVAPGHLSASIVVSGGALHVVEHRYGTGWVVERLLEIIAEHTVVAVGMDPTGPAGALLPELEDAGLVIRTTKTPRGVLVMVDGREMSQACEEILAAIVGGQLVHRDEGVLNAAVEGASRRQVGDSWKWSRRDSTVDISPLVAATEARHLWAAHMKPTYSGPLVAFK
jgi:hypothetical protein